MTAHPDIQQFACFDQHTARPHASGVIHPARNLQDVVCELMARIETLEAWRREYERCREGDGK